MKGQPAAQIANKAAIVLAFIGIFIGLTLTVAHYQGLVPPCTAKSAGCSIVLTSSYAVIGGVPWSLIGLLGYVFLAALSIHRSQTAGRDHRLMTIVGFAITALGTLTSAALTVVALGIIGVPCQWCLGSAATMTLLFLAHAVIISQPSPEEKTGLDVVSALAGAALALALFIPAMSSLQKSVMDPTAGMDVSRASRETLIPKDKSRVFGSPNAKVILAEFADPNCPSCRIAAGRISAIEARYGDKIAVVFYATPLYNLQGHETSIDVCAAFEFAAEKGKYKEFFKAVWDPSNTEQVKSETGLLLILKGVGLDADEFSRLKSAESGPDKVKYDKYISDIGAQMDLGRSGFGVSSTPTFVIWGEGAPSRALGAAELDSALATEPFRSLLQ